MFLFEGRTELLQTSWTDSLAEDELAETSLPFSYSEAWM